MIFVNCVVVQFEDIESSVGGVQTTVGIEVVLLDNLLEIDQPKVGNDRQYVKGDVEDLKS